VNPELISPAGFISKGGKHIFITDFGHLKKFVRRTPHTFPTAAQVQESLHPNSKFFWILYICECFFLQIELDEDTKHYT